MPVFVYNEEAIYLNSNQCLGLELILNLSDEYRKYIKLGDKLYDSFIQRKEYHIVNVTEYNWLKNNIQYLR
jgi:hypothetical protein